MMAKMFYTLEEAKAALSKNEEEIKQYAREGRLREFRDGPRLMFKADQVEQLKSELGGADQVDLGVSDSGGLIGLVDTTGASGTSITLSDTEHGGQAVGGAKKEDTALAADLGLSGSAAGMPSPRGSGSGLMSSGSGLVAASSGSGLGSGGHGSRSGINVLGTEEVGVDPSAQTAITSGVREQIDLASVGSGSGLLDLTRESDDTSLGAVLDEINPNASSRTRAAAVEISDSGMELDEPTGGVVRSAPPRYEEAHDPAAMGFGAACLAAALVVLLGMYAVLAGAMGANLDLIKWFDGRGWWFPAACGIGAVAVFFVIGMLTGKSRTA
jgi:hypothetical protein